MIDGDTLGLSDGRHVRLIGVNAPELAHRGRMPEEGAERARDLARRFLGGDSLGLVVGEDARDRYDRTLALVFRADGRSLEEELVAAGLARVVVISPNLMLADCLMAVERRARAARAGLWNTAAFSPRSAAGIDGQDGGFRLLRGTVTTVHRGRSTWWLELDRRVALEVTAADRAYFDWAALSALQGREVEARGWLVRRSSGSTHSPGRTSWMMRIGHPLMLEAVPAG